MAGKFEVYAGLLGGILGLAGSILGMVGANFFGNTLAGLQSTAGNAAAAAQTKAATALVIKQGWVGILASLIALVGALLVRYNAKRGALLLLIAAACGLVWSNAYYLLGGLAAGLAGVIALWRENEPKPPEPQKAENEAKNGV